MRILIAEDEIELAKGLKYLLYTVMKKIISSIFLRITLPLWIKKRFFNIQKKYCPKNGQMVIVKSIATW